MYFNQPRMQNYPKRPPQGARVLYVCSIKDVDHIGGVDRMAVDALDRPHVLLKSMSVFLYLNDDDTTPVIGWHMDLTNLEYQLVMVYWIFDVLMPPVSDINHVGGIAPIRTNFFVIDVPDQEHMLIKIISALWYSCKNDPALVINRCKCMMHLGYPCCLLGMTRRVFNDWTTW
jgi:hypothetical protein